MTDPVHDAEHARLSGKSWIQTFTGRKFTPLDPRPEDVTIEDIAHALSQKVRYTGHCKCFYSVGQHSIHVASILPTSFKLAGLLHDATEAYLPDVAAPIKGSVKLETPLGLMSFSAFEDLLADVIFEGLGLKSIRPLIDSPEVKRADLAMLAAEVRDIMGEPPEPWGLTQEPAAVSVYGYDADTTKRSFLAVYNQLLGA